MKCKEFIEVILDYLDGMLKDDALATFQSHLDGCKSCDSYLRSYEFCVRLHRGLSQLADSDSAQELPPQFVNAILAARAALPQPPGVPQRPAGA